MNITGNAPNTPINIKINIQIQSHNQSKNLSILIKHNHIKSN